MKKILLIEDSNLQRTVTIDLIKSLGLENEILEAANGEIAIELLGKFYQEIGLVLCDMVMPKISGPAFVEAVYKMPAMSNIPIIMVSELGSQSIIDSVKERNPNLAGYIVKPVNREKIKKAIDPFLDDLSCDKRIISH